MERKCNRCGLPESEHQLRHNRNHFFERKGMKNELKGNKGMLFVNLAEGRRIGIQFRHLHTEAIVRGVNQKTRLTYCGIFEIPADEKEVPKKITFGVAKCSDRDNFSRESGRKLSLTRALANGDHEFANDIKILEPETNLVLRTAASVTVKEKRGVVWKAYFDRIPKRKPEDPTPVVQETVEGVIVEPVITEATVLH